MINKITVLDDSMAILNQSYRLFCYQYDQRINETGLSGKAETLLAELRFLMDDQDNKGYAEYLRLVKAQRDEAMQHVTMDEDTLAQHREQLRKESEAPPENLSVTDAQQRAAHEKVSAWNAANAKTRQARDSVLMQDRMPPPAPKKGEKVTIPRRTSQHQRLFENIYTHATPTDLGHQKDVRNTNPTDVA